MPRTATRPTVPVPGAIGLPSSSMTSAFLPSSNFAPVAALRRDVIDRPMPLASLLFRKSIIITCGACASRRAFTSLLHIMPDDDTTLSFDKS